MSEELETKGGVSRRDMLKRSAMLGGALVWATPVVQSLGGTAYATTTGSPAPGCISFIALLLKCGDLYYGIKIDNAFCGSDLQQVECNTSADHVGGPSGDKCDTYWANIVTGAGSPTLNCDTSKVSISASNGVISVSAGCSIVGWVLHDGGCSSYPGGGPNGKYTQCYSNVGTTIDACGATVGTASSTSATFRKPCLDKC